MKTYTVTEYDQEDYDSARENMSNDEAVEILERIARGWIPAYDFDGTERDFENYKLHVALAKAIEMLSIKL